MTIGGTLMRQHNFFFDVENQKIGIARASCSDDANQVLTEEQLIQAGQRYGLDPTHTESLEQTCNHVGQSIRPPRTKHPFVPSISKKNEKSETTEDPTTLT